MATAKPTPLSNTARRPGESMASWGARLQAGDRALAAQQKTRSGATAGGNFNTKHPRGRGGKWITVGASGAEVRTVQRRVGAQADGRYGELTRRQVVAFQRAHGLQVDGVVGTQTVAAMRGNGSASHVAPGALTSADRTFLAGGAAKGARASGGRRRASGSRARAAQGQASIRTSAGQGVLVETPNRKDTLMDSALDLEVELGDLKLLEAASDGDGDEGSMPSVYCPKCKKKVTPKADGKCPTCGTDLSAAVKMARKAA